jgi:hypothetical protein
MRKDQRRVTVSVAGFAAGVFDTKTGGAIDSEELKHRSGGMGPQKARGGPITVENVTLTREVDQAEWALMREHFLRGVGKADVTVTDQPLDVDGNAFGQPLVYTGKLKRVMPPEHDANAADLAELEIEISTDGTVG